MLTLDSGLISSLVSCLCCLSAFGSITLFCFGRFALFLPSAVIHFPSSAFILFCLRQLLFPAISSYISLRSIKYAPLVTTYPLEIPPAFGPNLGACANLASESAVTINSTRIGRSSSVRLLYSWYAFDASPDLWKTTVATPLDLPSAL
jgi:hypothetical protein